MLLLPSLSMLSSIFATICTLATAAPPEPKIDIDHFDKTPLSPAAQQVRKLQNHVSLIGDTQRNIQLRQSDIHFARVTFSLKRKFVLSKLKAKVSQKRASSHFRVFEYPVTFEFKSQERNDIELVYAIQSKSKTPLGKHSLRLKVEIRQAKNDRIVVRHNLYHDVSVEPQIANSKTIDLDRQAFEFFQKRAKQNFSTLSTLPLQLSMRSVPTRIIRLPAEPTTLLTRFLFDRLRATVAYGRLMHLANTTTSALRTSAIYALASLNHHEPNPRNRLKHQLSSPQIALKHAQLAFDKLQFDDAEILASHSRNSGKLKKTALAKSLAILGAIDVVRKRAPQASRIHFGQALCLDSKVQLPKNMSIIKSAFGALAQSSPCPNGIIIGRILAKRRIENEKNMVYVTGEFGPDPYRLVSGGTIELWGAGGEIIEIAKIRASHGHKNVLTSKFEDRGDIQNYLGQILIRLAIKDVSGVTIAMFGDTEAIPIEINETKLSVTRHLGWWLWVLTGLAVAAGSTAVAIQLIDDEPQRGIGPISVRF